MDMSLPTLPSLTSLFGSGGDKTRLNPGAQRATHRTEWTHGFDGRCFPHHNHDDTSTHADSNWRAR